MSGRLEHERDRRPTVLKRDGLHFDLYQAQRAKHPPTPCGDVIVSFRDQRGTTVIMADGMGHGPTAFVAAQLYAARLCADLQRGRSLRAAFAAVCDTIQDNRGVNPIWAALSVLRVRHDGSATILGHETPPPLLLSERLAEVLPARPIPCGAALVTETLCHLRPGDGLLLMSDGLTQAGLGRGLPEGLGNEGVADLVAEWLRSGAKHDSVPNRCLDWLRSFPGGQNDDCSVVVASCRPGRSVTLFTGPPQNTADDAQVVNDFLACDGERIVCGATTAAIVAKHSGQVVAVDYPSGNHFVPPMSLLDGVDVVTEGAVTLTQVVNLLGSDLSDWQEEHGVARIVHLLLAADRVHIIHGTAANEANGDLSFRQIGVLGRADIVRLLRDKLSALGKYVDIEPV